MLDRVRVRGWVRVRKNGVLIREGENLVVKRGREILASRIGGGALAAPSHLAVGSSAAAVSDDQLALMGTEHQRRALDSISVLSNTVTYTGQLGPGLPSLVVCRELGIFNAAIGGDMLCRFITAEFQLEGTDVLDVDWTLQIGD